MERGAPAVVGARAPHATAPLAEPIRVERTNISTAARRSAQVHVFDAKLSSAQAAPAAQIPIAYIGRATLLRARVV
jgi:hypothetical protein